MSIVKSAYDTKNYKNIMLENGIQVLIIIDKKSVVSAASLSINIGYYNDPYDFPGLAHFLEHMIFMGTDKYPDENYFMNFLNNHGGSSNAYTSSEFTNYHFIVSTDKFLEALDIFANFFIGPIFKEDSVMREMKAVDSEHSKNISSDKWRTLQLLKNIANKHHPFSKFGTGNLSTLNKKNIRETLISFFNKYYSSNLMKLVVYDNRDVDEIEQFIRKVFEHIKNLNIKTMQYDDNVFDNSKNKIIKFLPVLKNNTISIYWQLPNLDKYYKYKSLEFLSYLIGHENDNGLSNFLKKKMLISDLFATNDIYDNSMTLFSVQITLTNKGLADTNFIIKVVDDYINFLFRSDLSTFYEEKKRMGKIHFNFMAEYDPLIKVSTTADDLFKYKIEDILRHKYIYENYEKTKKILNTKIKKYFSIKTLVLIGSSKFKEYLIENQGSSSVDNIYGTRFKYIETEHTTQFQMKIVKEIKFDLPVKNIFIPVDTKIINGDNLNKISARQNFEIWHDGENKFKMPKVLINIILRNDKIKKSAKNYVKFLLFLRCLQYKSSVVSYYSLFAGSFYDFSMTEEYDVKIYVSCYSDVVDKMIQILIESIKNFEISDKQFNNIFNDFRTNLKNSRLRTPYVLGSSYLNEKASKKYFTISEMLNKIDSVSVDSVLEAGRWLFGKCSLTSFVYGNISRENVKKNMSNFEIFVYKDYIHTASKYMIQLDDGDEEIYMKRIKNKNENDSYINIFFEIGEIIQEKTHDWDKIVSEIYLTHSLIDEKFFNKLRSSEQVGYIVQSGVVTLGPIFESIYGIIFVIQSNKFKPSELKQKIKKFIEDENSFIANLSEDKLDEYKKALVNQYKIPKYNIYEEFRDTWSHIYGRDYVFDENNRLVDAVEKITTSDIKNFYNKYFIDKKTRKVRIVELFKNHKY